MTDTEDEMTEPQTFTLHEMYDGNEPKIDLDPEIASRIKEVTGWMRKRPLNAYVCDNGHRRASRDVHVGGTPMWIQCPECGEPAKSAGHPTITAGERQLIEDRNREIDEYKRNGVAVLGVKKVVVIPDQPPWLEEMHPTIEWYRPNVEEFGSLSPDQQEYVLKGGLVRRDVS